MEHEGEKAGRYEDGSAEIIAACIEVHRHLGPGLLESAYERCLCHELSLRGLVFERQRELPLVYKAIEFDCGYRLDVVVGEAIVVEVKAVERLLPVHEAQALTYLRLTGLPAALVVNFNVAVLRQGLRRLSYNPRFPLPAFSPSCAPFSDRGADAQDPREAKAESTAGASRVRK